MPLMVLRMKKTAKIIIIVLLVLLLFGGFGIFYIKNSLKPVSNTKDDLVEIKIEDNWYGKKVFNYLQEQNVIKNATVAYYYSRLKKLDVSFKAGQYEIDRSMSLENIIAYLSDASNAIQDTVVVTLIEGYRLKDFAQIISEKTKLSYDELISYWTNEDEIKSIMIDYPFLTEYIFKDDVKYTLEGYLFPDTYEFFRDSSPRDITIKMLDNTKHYFEKYEQGFKNSEYTIHQIFTLASIIQRESSNNNDMKDVASVFYNRLNVGMQLQSSVTVCYALDVGLNEDWTKCEITQTDYDPYNTYQIYGFPPGPICAISEDALVAALYPNETEYFFFIGNVCGGGETIFAKTYAEQLENQARYLTCY